MNQAPGATCAIRTAAQRGQSIMQGLLLTKAGAEELFFHTSSQARLVPTPGAHCATQGVLKGCRTPVSVEKLK